MVKRVSVFCMLLLFFSCADKERVPKGIIPPEQMKMIVWDLMRVDEPAYKLKLDSSINTITNKQMVMYKTVFAIHKISRDEFYKSYAYYEAHPDLHKEMLDSLQTYANRQQMKLYTRDSAATKK
ncbi:DUF4296 domain-containing protein [Danxiaibacter flavus]|uniref:DUF4296 domain-containing protein n=1 Tax=Danxiaibacter flavus TaxID=3049108 RepID=A0ABV3ZJK0_9BACT|nr:DUF4296 domain-containing protein [Chitinophagaceae bacterium DXS]